MNLQNVLPRGSDKKVFHEVLLQWLPRIQDPLTLSICLFRILEPGVLKKSHRLLVIELYRRWRPLLRDGHKEVESTPQLLAACYRKVAADRDFEEILKNATDTQLHGDARYEFVVALKRFARKPGPAREALMGLAHDPSVGCAAIQTLADILKADALPLLQTLRQSSDSSRVRNLTGFLIRRLQARSKRIDLPRATPAMLPEGYEVTTIEMDTDRVTELFLLLEVELQAKWGPHLIDQLALSANQLKRGQSRFQIVR